jgi:hypothetical protein
MESGGVTVLLVMITGTTLYFDRHMRKARESC